MRGEKQTVIAAFPVNLKGVCAGLRGRAREAVQGMRQVGQEVWATGGQWRSSLERGFEDIWWTDSRPKAPQTRTFVFLDSTLTTYSHS